MPDSTEGRENVSPKQAPALVRIEVRDLFGYLSYDVGEGAAKASDVLILYGENGSGKTTLLRLLFYVLSPVDRHGHKTVVSRTVFSRFSVFFDNGLEVTASRAPGSQVGPFAMSINSGSELIHQYQFEPDNEGAIRPERDPTKQKEYSQFLGALKSVGIALYFLKDDRSIEGTLFDDRYDDEDEEDIHLRRRQKVRGFTLTIRAVNAALGRASQWIRTQAFRASTRGESNTYGVYLEIVRRVVAPRKGEGAKRARTVANALRRLREIAKRSERLASFGLIPKVDVSEMALLIRKNKKGQFALVGQVVWPYIEAMTARFNALERLASALEKFLLYLNKFFRGKRIVFDLRRGFLIHADRGEILAAENLSSGERHLLLLFCNVLVAEEQPSLFIIDEPELSLNVRWQRLLINALVDCVRQSQVRFVLATHSTEMLAQHRKYVCHLKPLTGIATGSGESDALPSVENA